MFYFEQPADYKGQLPESFQEYLEIKALDDCINLQLDRLFSIIKAEVNNRSVAYANSSGAARWENMLGITTQMNSSIEARRDAIRARLISKGPINLVTLKEIVQAYMGLEVEVSVDDYTVKIRYRGDSRIEDLQPLYQTIYQTIPANLLAELAYYFLTWDELDGEALTWNALDAKALTFYELERGLWLE